MLAFKNLFDCLREYVGYIAKHDAPVCFLTHTNHVAAWSFFDGTEIDEVWQVHNSPDTTTVLRLEPIAAVSALRVENPTDLVKALTDYAVFTTPRPNQVGLHNFISVPPPESVMQQMAEDIEKTKT